MTATTQAQTGSRDIITFRTSAEWSVRELTVFFSTVELMYGVFLSLSSLPRLRERTDDPRAALASGDDVRLLSLLTQGWAPALRFSDWPYDSDSMALLYPGAFRDTRSSSIHYEEEKGEFLRLLGSSVYRALPESRLQLHRIAISSPGIISFAGLGEPLKQLRELIKDIWYRNRQERRIGEIEVEIAQERLNAIRNIPGMRDPGSIDRAVFFLGNGAQLLNILHQGKKLESIEDANEIADS
jgi:hypothetical protein